MFAHQNFVKKLKIFLFSIKFGTFKKLKYLQNNKKHLNFSKKKKYKIFKNLEYHFLK